MGGLRDALRVGRMRRLAAVSLLVTLLTACAAQQPAAPSGGTGTLVIRAIYEEPPAGQPISFGGYGFFAAIDGGAETEVPFEGELRVEMDAGTHALAIATRPASDILVVGEDGGSEREFYDVSAACEGEVEVPSGGEVHVTYHAVGGEECRVTIEES